MPAAKDSRPLGLAEVGSYKNSLKKSHACVPLIKKNIFPRSKSEKCKV